MKKLILFATLIALMTACDGKKTSSTSTESATSSEQSTSSNSENSSSVSGTSTVAQTAEEPVSDSKWKVSPYDGGFESIDERTMYNGDLQLCLSSYAEVTSDEVGIEEKGSGKGLYYAISPTIKITEPVKTVNGATIAIELLDESGTPIPYTMELAGSEYTNTVYNLANVPTLTKALKEGGECKLSFLIKPVNIVDFSTDMFDNAKYFRITGFISASPAK